MIRPLSVASIAVCIACATAPPDDSGGAKSPAPAEGELRTPAGAKLVVPPGLTASVEDTVVRLNLPEADVFVAVVELEAAAGLAGAIPKAWTAAGRKMDRAASRTMSPPAKDGWDEIMVINYVAGPDDENATAIGRRKGARAWIALVRGSPGSIDKRAAQMRAFMGSLEAPGVEEARLDGRPLISIAKNADALDAFITKGLDATGTPGLQIAVVEKGEIVFARGYGVRALGESAKVTPDTLMMIGSVSKSMTTLMMGSLVDTKELSWEAKVTDVYPEFRLGDQERASALQVQHLVCACAGMPRKDVPLIIEFEGKGPDDVFRELAMLSPSTGLKETFQYQNHMVAAGGFVAAHAAAKEGEPLADAYARLMKERVFGPLSMSRSTLDQSRAVADDNHAQPHSMDLEGVHRSVKLEHEAFARYVGPSGGIWSSANEMARYVISELAGGVAPDGKRVVSQANVEHRRERMVAISDDIFYGLGWIVGDKRGLTQISHGGGTMGFGTKLAFFPEVDAGVIMIANGTGGHLVERMALERLLELWFDVDLKSEVRFEFSLNEQKKQLKELAERISKPDAAWMKPYIGNVTHPELGPVSIAARGEDFVFDAGVYVTRLLRHDRKDGKKALLFQDPPLAGIELVIVEDKPGTLELTRAQERYVLTL